VIELDHHRVVVSPEGTPHRFFLSTACLFDGPNDNSFRFFPREIRNGQVRDGLSLTGLFVRIDGNLSNLYCYPRRAAVNNRNIFFFFPGQGITFTRIACLCHCCRNVNMSFSIDYAVQHGGIM
jgi:hypothetical protein